MSVLQQVFCQQLQSHFNLLTQAIPSLKEIQWTSSQEDENLYLVTGFELTKHNGYNYKQSDESTLSFTEFTEEEFFLLNEFMEYIESSSKALVVVFGNFTFSLISE